MRRRRICFECKAVDDRKVIMHRDRYEDHILAEHPELLRDFDLPAQQIQHALENAASVLPGQGGALMYKGPEVVANPPAGRCRIWVIVAQERSDKTRWWVVTAYGELVLGG
jgi:hypothetical protein